MMYEQRDEAHPSESAADFAVLRPRSERVVLGELIQTLAPHPGGLRRWSVMRAIRTARERTSRDVPQKFEADIERIFRRYCTASETIACKAQDALFFRPAEKAGEVWAVFPARAKAWLAAESVNAG